MSRRLIIPPGTTTDSHGVAWTTIAVENSCVDANGDPLIEELGDQWCIDNQIDGLGICVELVLPLPLTPEQINYETLIQRATKALTANGAYLALTSPTQAQAVAQVKVLTRECNALIRLAVSALDDISDTNGG